MRKKLDNLWHCICTPLLLTSVTALLFGCASRNPLIDEDTPVDDDKTIVAAIEADEQKLREQQREEARKAKEVVLAKADKPTEMPVAEKTSAQGKSDGVKADSHVETIGQNTVKSQEKIKKSVAKKEPSKKNKTKNTPTIDTGRVLPIVPTVTEKAESIVKPVEPEHISTEASASDVKEVDVSKQKEQKSLEIVPEFHAPERRPIAYSAYGNTDRGEKEEILLNSPPRPIKKWMIFFTPYRVNQQQGNFISSEMLERLQPGMTKEQVRFVLGTPLLMDIFHANRWDYPFRLLKSNRALTTYRVAIFFNKDGVVESVKHDSLPSEVEYLDQISSDDDVEDKPKKEGKDKTEQTTDHHMTGDFQPGHSPMPIEAGTDHPSPEELERQLPTLPPIRTTGGVPDAHKPDYVPGRVSRSGRVSRPLPNMKALDQQSLSAKDAIMTVPEIKGDDGTAEKVVDYQSLPSYRTGTYGNSQSGIPRPISAFRPSTVQEPIEGTVSEEKRSEWIANRDAMLRALHAYDDVEGDGIKNLTFDSIKKFETISVPKRTGKMVPESPNLKQIGNIQ